MTRSIFKCACLVRNPRLVRTVLLADSAGKLALARTHPTEIKPEGNYRGINQSLADGKNHIIEHIPTIEGMGMTDHHSRERTLSLW